MGIKKAHERLPWELDPELLNFYHKGTNGLLFSWVAKESLDLQSIASVSLPNLKELVKHVESWKGILYYTPEQIEEYGFPHTDNPALAKQTAERMNNWVPLLGSGEADLICVDLGAPGCPVVYHKHDWMDGGTGENGTFMAANWTEFLESWSKVCFQDPFPKDWPEFFLPEGGIDWESDSFAEPFRLK